MTEIKKITKVSLLIYGIVNIIYGPMALFFPNFFIDLGIWSPAIVPYSLRFGGATLLGIAIFCFIIVFRKNLEWEKAKLTYEFLYYLLILNLILEPEKLIYGTPTDLIVMQTIMDIIIMGAILVLGVFSYIKQRSLK